MEGGEADTWKEQYISSITNKTTGKITFEMTNVLIKKLSDFLMNCNNKRTLSTILPSLGREKGQ
jgi:hypothetical protein